MISSSPGTGEGQPDGRGWSFTPSLAVGALAFAFLFFEPATTLLRDWWNDPEAAHGLLLGPLAVVLMVRSGLIEDRHARPVLGLTILAAAILLRIASGLAAELFTMRMSMFGALLGLAIYRWGLGQIRHWWLPVALLLLTVPIPAVILGTVALPLQLQASEMGAALLRWRDIPVALSGNVIHLPGRSLFVTEACSGLRSLTALLSLGLLMGGLWLRSGPARATMFLAAIPVAMIINGWRVFLTGFLVVFVDPSLGEGFMHMTEGWLMFVLAFGILGGIAWLLLRIEDRIRPMNGRLPGAPSDDSAVVA